MAILPHEVTHVVLADLFPSQQIPRWADEGMAVLAEPHSEQRLRAADLDKPLTSGQLFKLNELMVMDYPDGKYWSLYYAQSVSLTRFLVDQEAPRNSFSSCKVPSNADSRSSSNASTRSTASTIFKSVGSTTLGRILRNWLRDSRTTPKRQSNKKLGRYCFGSALIKINVRAVT